jgi:predicted RNA-binding protein YlqC (UPF0109 family)
MKELIEKIARALVDNPNEVVVSELKGRQSTIYELKVAKSDIGKIIGKNGGTVSAIRTILSGASGKARKRITLEILE